MRKFATMRPTSKPEPQISEGRLREMHRELRKQAENAGTPTERDELLARSELALQLAEIGRVERVRHGDFSFAKRPTLPSGEASDNFGKPIIR